RSTRCAARLVRRRHHRPCRATPRRRCGDAWRVRHPALRAPAGTPRGARAPRGTGPKPRAGSATRAGCSRLPPRGERLGHQQDHRDGERVVDEACVALLDREPLAFALLGDATQSRFESESIAPELRALVLGEQRELLGLLFVQLGFEVLREVIEELGHLLDLFALASFERPTEPLQTLLRARADRAYDGFGVLLEARAQGVEERVVDRAGHRGVQPVAQLANAVLTLEGGVSQVTAGFGELLVEAMVIA